MHRYPYRYSKYGHRIFVAGYYRYCIITNARMYRYKFNIFEDVINVYMYEGP